MKKIILINIVLIAFALIVAEFTSFMFAVHTQKKFAKENNEKYDTSIERYLLGKYYKISEYSFFQKERIRPVAGEKYKKRPVIIFGCSHAYGMDLDDDQTISYKLAHFTKRPVYNKAFLGWGVQHMLYWLQYNQEIYQEIKNPEYIIYVYSASHIERLYMYQGWPHDSGKYLRYKLDKNKQPQVINVNDYPLYWRLFFVKYIQYYLQNIQAKKTEQNMELFKAILKETSKIIKIKYPNTRIIMLLYPSGGACDPKTTPPYNDDYYFDKETRQEIKDLGFEIINSDDFLNGHPSCEPKYKCAVNHPSEAFWDEIIPKLAKKLDM